MRLRPLLLAIPFIVAGSQLWAQDATQRVPTDPHVIVGTLPNGVRYFIRENRRPEKRAELRLALNAGSILEDDAQQGLAHFAEHMAFNGTRSFAKQEIVSYLESIGMRFGADLNAYTSFDETVYMLQVPTDSTTPLEKGVQILEEWAHAITFDSAEVDKERGVVIEEWRLGQGADERLRQQYFPVLFRNSRYETRLPIGQKTVLETFRRDALVRFYRDWYRPDLMAVIAVGDFDAKRVEQLIRDRFGRIAAARTPRARTAFEVPDHTETLVAIATDKEATGTSVEVDWKLPKRPDGTVAAFRESLARSLYSSMLNARFSEIAQKANPPFIGAGSSYAGLIRTRDAYSLGAAVPDTGVERGLDALLTEAERVARHGFTATELERERTNLLRAYERMYAEREKTESSAYASEYVSAFLEDEPIPGIAWEFEQAQRLAAGITLAEVNAFARQWMTDRSRVVIVTAPEKPDVKLPTKETLLAVFDRVARKDIRPYEDIVATVPLLAAPPAPGRVQSREPIPEIDTELLTLSNGVRVFVKRTDFKDDQVVVGGYSAGGLSLVADRDFASGLFSSTLVNISGLGELDQIQLGKALAGKPVSVEFGVSGNSEVISASASPRDLETMFQLLYLHFTAPRNDSVAFSSYATRLRAVLANRSADPASAFQDTMQVTRWQYHNRARPIGPAFVDEIDRATSHRIFRERFADVGDFTFVVVGALGADVTGLIERYIGGLPARNTREQIKDIGMRPARGVIEKVVRRGIEPKSQTHLVFSGDAQYSRENRLVLGMLADIVDMKLRDVLREDLGGTYGVSISQSLQRLPQPGYTFEIEFGAAPPRLEELTKTVFAELEKLKANGPDAQALAKVKEQQRRGYETNVKQNEYWLSVLLRQAETSEEAKLVLDFPQRVEAITAEQIREAARRYLDTRNYVRVSLYPAGG